MPHIIIYSRLSSSRLKRKALIKLSNNKMLIEQVISQAKQITSSKKIILATTTNKEDKLLCDIAKINKINFFQGSEKNLLERTQNCCKKFKIKYFLRYCGDRPIVDVNKIKKCFTSIKNKKKFDLMTTNFKDIKIDKGFTIEIFNSDFFIKFKSDKVSKDNKEHLGNYIYQNPKKFRILMIKFSKIFFKERKYTIDDKNDLKMMNYILKNYKNKNIKEVVSLYSKYEKFS